MSTGRIVGDSDYYEFFLQRANGTFARDISIKLPSVTTVIKKTLAAPALTRWHYTQTRDLIAGYVSQLVEHVGDLADNLVTENADGILDVLSDADLLEEALKENKLRPMDVTREAADTRGDEGHSFLAHLCSAQMDDEYGPEFAVLEAEKAVAGGGVKAGVGGWWLARLPIIHASEKTVYSLEPHGGFAGTLDLIWRRDGDYGLTLSDLKTRKADREMYDGDDIQTSAYEHAVADPAINRRTVIVAREDGTWDEYSATVDFSVFAHLLGVFKELNA